VPHDSVVRSRATLCIRRGFGGRVKIGRWADRWLFAFAVLLVASTSALGDVVELKNGQRVEGTLKQATPASVSIEVAGQTITFDGDKVRAIFYGRAPTTPSVNKEVGGRAAITALRELQSVTEAAVTYRDYSTRVGDVKMKVDRDVEGASEPARAAIKSALAYYVAAGSWWSMNVSNPARGGFMIDTEQLPRACGHYQQYVDRQIAMGYRIATIGSFTQFPDSSVLGVFWSCAADKVADAEQLLNSPK